MKKIVFVLVALIFAAPALAEVTITIAQVDDTNEVIISVNNDDTGNLVRAYSLDIKLTPNGGGDPNILEVTALNADYYVFPGTIQINADGDVTNPGTPVAEYGDLPSDTLAGLDSNGVTVELASLYAPVGPTSPNAPANGGNGALLSVKVSGSACITVTANVPRAGASGVVMEDPDQNPVVSIPTSTTPLCIEVATDECECWADLSGDTVVSTTDMNMLLFKLFEKVGTEGYRFYTVPEGFECMDLNADGWLDTTDMNLLLFHLFTYGMGQEGWASPCMPAPPG